MSSKIRRHLSIFVLTLSSESQLCFWYRTVNIMAPNRAEVWKYFAEPEYGKAMCKLCRKKLACANSSTTGLRRNIEIIHKLKLDRAVNVSTADQVPTENQGQSSTEQAAPTVATDSTVPETQPTAQKHQASILNFMVNESRDEIVARLIALDGICLRSRFIRQSFAARNLKLPKCEKAIMKIVHNFFEEAE